MESMNIVIIILISAASLVTIYSLGHLLSMKNELFLNNSFAEWVVGAVAYFAITFLAFFPFIIIKVSVSYFVVIFFIKELLVWTVLIYWREDLLKGINIKDTIWIIMAGVTIVLVYNLGITKLRHVAFATHPHKKFFSWKIYEEVLQKFTGVKMLQVKEWMVSFIVGSTIYASVAAIFSNFIRSNGYLERITSLIVVILVLLVMGFGVTLSDSLGVFLISFLMLLGIRLIIYSRRRYGALFGVVTFVTWSMSPDLLATITVVAIIIIVIYTYRVRPKPSLFFVQLMMPLIMIISLEFYSFNAALSLILFFLSLGMYGWILTAKNNPVMERLNIFLLKYKVIIPTVTFFVGVTIISIIVGLNNEKTFAFTTLITTTRPLFYFGKMPYWLEITERVVFGVTAVSTLFGGGYALFKGKEFSNEMLFMTFVTLAIIIAYNPLVEKALSLSKTYYPQFGFLKMLILPPLVIAGATKIMGAIKNRIR